MIDLLIKGTVTIGIAFASLFGMANNAEAPYILGSTFQTPEVRALFETTLAVKITSSATSMTLTSATDKDGTVLASSTYGFIIDEGTSVEEIVLADCTGTACINMTRGISVATGTTTVSALQFEHRRGASVKITDAPILLFLSNVVKGRQNLENKLTYNSALSFSTSSNQIPSASWVSAGFVDTTTNESIGGTKSFTGDISVAGVSTFATTSMVAGTITTVPASANDIANKSYVDGVSIAGAPNASATVKGIVKLSVAPASSTNPIAVGDNDTRLGIAISLATTTSTGANATTTISGLSDKKSYKVYVDVASSTNNGGTTQFRMTFNSDNSLRYHSKVVTNNGSTDNPSINSDKANALVLGSYGAPSGPVSFQIEIDNSGLTSISTTTNFTSYKMISWTGATFDVQKDGGALTQVYTGYGAWASSTPITSISFWNDSGLLASTSISVYGK